MHIMPIIMVKFALPTQATEQIAQLGQRIRIARIRRGWSVADLASKAGINRNTLTALELGKPGTAVGVCVTVLWALGLDKSLDAVAHSVNAVKTCLYASVSRICNHRRRGLAWG